MPLAARRVRLRAPPAGHARPPSCAAGPSGGEAALAALARGFLALGFTARAQAATRSEVRRYVSDSKSVPSAGACGLAGEDERVQQRTLAREVMRHALVPASDPRPPASAPQFRGGWTSRHAASSSTSRRLRVGTPKRYRPDGTVTRRRGRVTAAHWLRRSTLQLDELPMRAYRVYRRLPTLLPRTPGCPGRVIFRSGAVSAIERFHGTGNASRSRGR